MPGWPARIGPLTCPVGRPCPAARPRNRLLRLGSCHGGRCRGRGSGPARADGLPLQAREVCPARAVSPAGPCPAIGRRQGGPAGRPPAGLRAAGPRAGLRRPPGGLRRPWGWVRAALRLGLRGAPARPPGGHSVGLRGVPWMGLQGAPSGPAAAPWVGLAGGSLGRRAGGNPGACGRHPGWASSPCSGPPGRRARRPAPAPRACRRVPCRFPAAGFDGAGKVSAPPGPAPASGRLELPHPATGRARSAADWL